MLHRFSTLALSLAILLSVGYGQSPFQSVEEFASALLEARSDQQRAGLLQANKRLVTVELEKTLFAEGGKFYGQRKWEQALSAYSAAQSVASLLDDKSGAALARTDIGRVYYNQGRFKESLDYFQQSLTLRRELGDKTGIARSMFSISLVHSAQRNTSSTLEWLTHCYQMLGEIKDEILIGEILNGLGIVYRRLGNFVQAMSYYQQALKHYQKMGFKVGIAGVQLNVSNLHQEMGNYDLALDHLQNVLKHSESEGNKSLLAKSLNSVGTIYYSRGNYGRANEFYEKSLRIKEELGEVIDLRNTLSNIGNTYEKQGNYEQALRSYLRSSDLNKSTGDRTWDGFNFNSIGSIYVSQQNYAKAFEYLQRALQIGEELKSHEVIADSLKRLGVVYYEQGNKTKASEALERSLSLFQELGNREFIVEAFSNLASFYLMENRFEEALQFAAQGSAIAKELGRLDDLSSVRAIEGESLIALDRVVEARAVLDEALEIIETVRAQVGGGEFDQSRFLEGRISPYQAITRLLVRQNQPEEALRYAERMKARLLLDVLQSGRIDITKAMTPGEKEQERALRNEMVSFNSQVYTESARPQPDQARLTDLHERLEKARLAQQAFQTRLYAAHPYLKVQRGQIPAFNLKQAAELLPDSRTALLEYVITRDKTFLFVITPAIVASSGPALKVYEIPIHQEELTRLAHNYRQLLATHNLIFVEPAAKLYNLLIKPAEAELRGKTQIVIVPDGPLWELPFQALRTDRRRYLIESYSISYTPSLSVLSEMQKQRRNKSSDRNNPTLLAFGNPGPGKQQATLRTRAGGFEALPETETEVNALARLYGVARSKVYTGQEAREERLKAEAGEYSRLHLATHGVLNDTSPMYSQIVLSPPGEGSQEDGFLEAWEVLHLNLDCDLVVLSACETARGRVSDGEGMIGLAWSLFVAGSPSTVVSQWKVDAASTTGLMLEFHRNLRANNSKADALRKATLRLLQNTRYKHPFYWAPFVIVGDAK